MSTLIKTILFGGILGATFFFQVHLSLETMAGFGYFFNKMSVLQGLFPVYDFIQALGLLLMFEYYKMLWQFYQWLFRSIAWS